MTVAQHILPEIMDPPHSQTELPVFFLLQQPTTAAEVQAAFAVAAPASHTDAQQAFYHCCSLPKFMLL